MLTKKYGTEDCIGGSYQGLIKATMVAYVQSEHSFGQGSKNHLRWILGGRMKLIRGSHGGYNRGGMDPIKYIAGF